MTGETKYWKDKWEDAQKQIEALVKVIRKREKKVEPVPVEDLTKRDT